MDKIICKNCGAKYEYNLVGTVYPGGKDRETADCPICGETGVSRMTSQYFVVKLIETECPCCKKMCNDGVKLKYRGKKYLICKDCSDGKSNDEITKILDQKYPVA